jgi:hypothetical protein
MSAPDLIAEVEAALAFPNTALIIRGPAVIAEIRGPLALRRGSDWLTIGEDQGTHVHLRAADIVRCRLVQAQAANLQLELQDAASTTLCKVSFRNTNAAKTERFDPELSAQVKARFGHLVG